MGCFTDLLKSSKQKKMADGKIQVLSHPLMNDMVVEIVMGNCSQGNFRNFRSVNACWYNAATRLWRKKYSLIVRPNIKPADGYSYEAVTLPINEMKNFYRGNKFPFNDVTIKNLIIGGRWSLDRITKRSVYEVIKPFASSIESLRFESCYVEDANALRKILNKCPNLKRLSFKSVATPEGVKPFEALQNRAKNGDIIPGNLKYLEVLALDELEKCEQHFKLDWLSHLLDNPHLEVIKIENQACAGCPACDSQIIQLINSLNDAKEVMGRQLKLRKLEMDGHSYMTDEMIDKLCQVKLALEKLSVGWNQAARVSNTSFEHLIQKHRETLKSFHCTRKARNTYRDATPDLFPDTLTSLSFTGNIYKTAEFLKWAPNLKKLELDLKTDVIQATDAESHYVLHNLEEFTYKTPQPCTPEVLKTIAKWAPNLKKLTVRVMSDGFPVICEMMPQLENLVLLKGSEVNNTAFTGVSFRDPYRKPNPNITNLKNLRSFSMEYFMPFYRIGARSIRYGFCKLESLEELNLNMGHNATNIAYELLHKVQVGESQYRNQEGNLVAKFRLR